jgi:DNA-binding NarL/FixJ family response regulator
MIGVLIVDDERLVREGLRTLIELDGGLAVVGEAADAAAALALLEGGTRVDVMLLDIRMPRRSGLELLADLGDRAPPTLVLTTFDDAELLLASVRAGARGFSPKDVALEELVAGIRALARGDTWFQPALTETLRRAVSARNAIPAPGPVERLTQREREILRLMAGGHSNREIADVLSTAEGTVKNQVSSILAKLGVRDRTRAVLKAIESGLV